MDEEIAGMRFATPESYVTSLRLNREESRVLTEAARFHGIKLSTYIKTAAVRAARTTQVKWAHADGLDVITVA